MRNYDLSPLFRSTVGFDRMNRLLDTALSGTVEAPSYPPYNIEKSGDTDYRIFMAVAGFTEADLDVTQHQNTLTVKGKIADGEERTDVKVLHRGIATRAFERRFELADHIDVTDAKLENGLLVIDLKREVPEAMKPRHIDIGHEASKVIEQKAA